MRQHRVVTTAIRAFALCAALLGCSTGGGNATSIDDIPPDKKLVDLDESEQQGVCNWAQSQAHERLPADGTQITCDGQILTFNGAMSCDQVPAACTATVKQWEACVPSFLDGVAKDPCVLIEASFSNEDVGRYIESLPGCMGLGPCGTAMQ